jgi:hypothetical protein
MPNTDESFKNTGTEAAPPSNPGSSFWDTFSDLINNAPAIIDSITGAKKQPPGTIPVQETQKPTMFTATNIIMVAIAIVVVLVVVKLIKKI